MVNKIKAFITVLIVICAACTNSQAASLLVSPHVYHYELNSYVEYMEDKDGSLEVEDILLDYQSDHLWQKNTQGVPNLGFSSSAYWFRINIVNPTEYPFYRLLEIAYPLLDSVSIYQIENGQLMANYIAGNKISFRSRPIQHRHLVFPIEISAETQSHIYLRVESGNGIQLPLYLWEERVFWNQDQYNLAWQFLYYGLMLVMIAYNLFIAWGVRDNTYLYYVLTMASVCVFQAILHGAAFQFMWPTWEKWNAMSMAIFIPLSNGVAGIFSYKMLKMKERTPILAKVLRISYIISFIMIGLAFVLPYNIAVPFSAAFVILSASIVCIACLKRWPDKEKDARIFAVAWFVFVSGCVTMAMNKFALIPYSWLSENLMQIGSGIETVLLSLALAERINRLREDKVLLQKNQLDTREREIAAEKELLEAKYESKAKSDFLAVMSHEIRTPMNGVLGVLDLLKETPLNNEQNKLVSTIQSSGKLLLNIINDILDFSKIEAGKLELESIPFSLEQVISDSIAIYNPNAQQKNLTIAFYVDPEIPKLIKGDPTRLKQVIYNLLGNAIKFTDKGHVFVKARLGSGNQIRIEVMDSGIGMSEDQVSKLFESFTQAEKSTSRKFGGTGLGLAISKKLIEAMAGKIGVHSHPGEGSTFWVELNNEPASDPTPIPEKKLQLIVCSDYLPLIDFIASGLNSAYYSIQPVILSGFQTQIPQYNISFDKALVYIEKNPAIEPKVCSFLAENNQLSEGEIIVLNHSDRNDQLALNKLFVVDAPFNIEKLLTEKPNKTSTTSAASSTEPDHENYSLDLSILVVEDNPVNQMVIKGMLKPLVGDVDVANNGREAVDKYTAAKNHYDLIFMDCEMPEMDGYEATEHIRKFEESNQCETPVKIVALTAHAFEEFKEKAFSSGMNAHLTKPINRKILIDFFNTLDEATS